MKQRQCEPEYLLKLFLDLVHGRPSIIGPASWISGINEAVARRLAVDRRSDAYPCQRYSLHGDGKLTSFSPNENTGTRSALRGPVSQHNKNFKDHDSPFPHGNFDKPKPLPQRQIVRPRMRRQALGGSTDDNGDSASGALAQNVCAGFLGDAAQAEVEEKVTVDGNLEVRCCADASASEGARETVRTKREEVGLDSRE